MKTAAAVFAALLLLVFSGCRSPASATPEVEGAPSAPAAAVSREPDTAQEGSQTVAGEGTPPGEKQPGVSPGGETEGEPDSGDGAVQGEALDDILKVLSELDRLYSQLDDLSESDLAE